jgi:hypothetical protein
MDVWEPGGNISSVFFLSVVSKPAIHTTKTSQRLTTQWNKKAGTPAHANWNSTDRRTACPPAVRKCLWSNQRCGLIHQDPKSFFLRGNVQNRAYRTAVDTPRPEEPFFTRECANQSISDGVIGRYAQCRTVYGKQSRDKNAPLMYSKWVPLSAGHPVVTEVSGFRRAVLCGFSKFFSVHCSRHFQSE